MRISEVSRTTRETEITVRLDLDGTGKGKISTGIGFFDHMLEALKVHSGMDLIVQARGDLEVDAHHTVEDTGIVLGQALAKALGDRSGIARYGHDYIPMDEALAFCALDISGRPVLVFGCPFHGETLGTMGTDLVEEFFRALSVNAGFTLHLKVLYGKNDHHQCEAVFKAFAHALRKAASQTGSGTLSTKGVL